MTADEFNKWLEHMGISDTQLAEWLDVNRRTIALYKAGRRPDASAPGGYREVAIPRTVEAALFALERGWRPKANG